MIEYNNKSNGDETTKQGHLSLIRMAQKQKHLSYPLITSLDVYFQMLSQPIPNPFRLTPINSSSHLSQQSTRLRLSCHILKKLSILPTPYIKGQTLYGHQSSSQRSHRLIQQYYTAALQFLVNQFMTEQHKASYAQVSSRIQHSNLLAQDHQKYQFFGFGQFLSSKKESIKRSRLPASQCFLMDIIFHLQHYYYLYIYNNQSESKEKVQQKDKNESEIADQLLISKQRLNMNYWSRVRVGLSLIQSHKKFKKWRDIVILRRGLMEPSKDFLNWVSSQNFQHKKVQQLISILTLLEKIKQNNQSSEGVRVVQVLSKQKEQREKEQSVKVESEQILKDESIQIQEISQISVSKEKPKKSRIRQMCYGLLYNDRKFDWQQFEQLIAQLLQFQQQNETVQHMQFNLAEWQTLWTHLSDAVQSYQKTGVQAFFRRQLKVIYRHIRDKNNDQSFDIAKQLQSLSEQIQYRRSICQRVRDILNIRQNILSLTQTKGLNLQKDGQGSLSFQIILRKLETLIKNFVSK